MQAIRQSGWLRLQLEQRRYYPPLCVSSNFTNRIPEEKVPLNIIHIDSQNGTPESVVTGQSHALASRVLCAARAAVNQRNSLK